VNKLGIVALTVLLAGCSGNAEVPRAAESVSSSARVDSSLSSYQAADKIRGKIPEVTQLIALNEDNDANQLIGRPNGYTAATAIVDSRGKCPNDGPGVDCGATVEQWPDQAGAQRRADYLQKMKQAMPIAGTEWTTVQGPLLLRVTGKLKPSVAKTYQDAFSS
jgi:serine/threonine-protein kinase